MIIIWDYYAIEEKTQDSSMISVLSFNWAEMNGIQLNILDLNPAKYICCVSAFLLNLSCLSLLQNMDEGKNA